MLPAGLTERSFEDAISDAVFVGRAGFGERAVDFETDGTALSLVFSTSVDWTKCDLNGDAGCDVADLDELYSLMSSSRIEADLNADGAVDQSDINEWLVAASDSLNPAKTRSTDVYEPGDVDLNGVVDRIDLGLVLNSFGESDANGWSQGNLDGIDGVDSRDLGLVLNSFTSSSSSSVAVPEPMGAMPLAFLGLGLWMALRRRQ